MKLICLLPLLLAGCVKVYNVKLKKFGDPKPITCAFATGQDEGGVCWSGYNCDDGKNHTDGCYQEVK